MVEKISRVRKSVEQLEETVVVVTASGVGIEDEKRKTLRVRKFTTEPAYVRVSAGVTKSTGNYESLRVDVALTVPCYVEEIEKVQARTAELVSEMLSSELDEYMGTGT